MKKLIPKPIKTKIRSVLEKFKLKKVHKHQEKYLEELQNKKKVKIAFLSIYLSIWKYEKLYFLLKNNPNFEVIVFTCPFMTYGEKIMKEELQKTYNYFKNKGYNVINTQNIDGSFIDIRKEFNPDLVFFTSPWYHTLPKYEIENFFDKLTCYVDYAFNSSSVNIGNFNMNTQKYAWKVFAPTSYHAALAKQYSNYKGKNYIVTGYPGIDDFLDLDYKIKSPWKKQEKQKKKIIWAPHHTIPQWEGNKLNYSTFMDYAMFMLDIAKKYKDTIQFSFKPHPNLKGKLMEERIWGKDKTEAYYQTWENLENTQLEEGDYIDLFLSSDALIHDCGSFLLEYMATKKPMLYLIKKEEVKEEFNLLGKKALKQVDQAYNKEDIIDFIENVVLNNIDNNLIERNAFVEKELLPPHNKLASENIYNYLCEQFNIPLI